MGVTKLGLYEQMLDDATQAAIAELDQKQFRVISRYLDAGDSHSYLVQHLARQIGFVLRSLQSRDGLTRKWRYPTELSNC